VFTMIALAPMIFPFLYILDLILVTVLLAKRVDVQREYRVIPQDFHRTHIKLISTIVVNFE
jgi:hypothetical protein